MRDSARSVLVDGDGGDMDQSMRLGFAMQSGDDAGTQATGRRDRLRDPGLPRMPDGAAVLVVMQGQYRVALAAEDRYLAKHSPKLCRCCDADRCGCSHVAIARSRNIQA
jgi:hypothetical protein